MNESVSIIVPTLNPGENVPELREALMRQQLRPSEVVIVDSTSEDGSPEQWRAAGFRVLGIQRADFDHGGARNLGARACRGNILVFMTQDAVPADEYWLEKLISSIVSGETVAAFARQLSREGADPLERFSRTFNYPALSRVKELRDVSELGVRAFFFSNVCSAVKANVFWEVGGFPEGVIFNEDVMLCAKLLRAGYKVKYEADARVYHSHSYGTIQQFRRNFDNGVSFSQAGGLLEGARTRGEGMNFVLGQARHVWRSGDSFDLLRVFGEAATRLIAFNLGRGQRYIPARLKRHLSMHSDFWKGP